MGLFQTIGDTLKGFFNYQKDRFAENNVTGSDYFTTGYDMDVNGKPIPGTGESNLDNVITADTESVVSGAPVEAFTEGNQSIPDLTAGVDLNNAYSFSKLKGKNVEEQLEWLVENDPDNRTGWLEKLLDVKESRENTSDARAYQLSLDDTRIQRTAKDLEAAGINPILAYQYLTGSSTNVGTANSSSSSVANNETQRGTNSESGLYGLGKTAIGVIGMIIAALIRKKK